MILINPQAGREKQLGYFARYVPFTIPLGIGCLAGYLQSKNKKVKILDEEVAPITEEILRDAVSNLEKPYIFGLSCLTANIGRGYALSKMIKNLYPDSYVIFGHIHPTVLPEEALNTGYVDIVVRGEGELVLESLYDALKNHQDFFKINGISFIKDGKVIHNPIAAPIDLKNLSVFPYHLFNEKLYDFSYVVTSRGCPYNCIFCSQKNISGGRVRYFNTDYVIEQFKLLVNKYNQKYICLVDDNFVVDKERVKKVCEAIVKENLHQKAFFSCQTRGDAITEEILTYLKRANFKIIGLGLETASERLMKIINKGEKVADNIKAAKLIKSMGFNVAGAFILGLPTETKEERWQAYKLAKELDIDYVRFNNATPYPGTALYEIAKQEGRLNIYKTWENFNAVATLVGGLTNIPLAYVPMTTKERELKKDILKTNFYFSMRPKKIIQIFTDGKNANGWFILPDKWYFSPKELYYLGRLGFYLVKNFIMMFVG